MERYLIVGLGNPGKRYIKNRHNVGFMALDKLANSINISFTQKVCNSLVGITNINQKDLILSKPQTYMNLSGESVSCLVNKFQIDINKLIVIYDDYAIPLGKIRIRERGSSGGHRGMQSIINHLSNDQIIRIRIGIGKPPQSKSLEEYVLENFNIEEKEYIDQAIINALDAIKIIVLFSPQEAMNKLNK